MDDIDEDIHLHDETTELNTLTSAVIATTSEPSEPSEPITSNLTTSFADAVRYPTTTYTNSQTKKTNLNFELPDSIKYQLQEAKDFESQSNFDLVLKVRFFDNDTLSYQQFTSTIETLQTNLSADTQIANIIDDIYISYEKANDYTNIVYINITGTHNPTLLNKVQAISLATNDTLTETEIITTPLETIKKPLVLKTEFPVSIHPNLLKHVCEDIYAKYGKVIYSDVPSVPKTLIKADSIFTVFTLMDFDSDFVPPVRAAVINQGKTYPIKTLVNSPMLYCAYCNCVGHNKHKCPTRKGCAHCKANDHKLINCKRASNSTILYHLNKLPEEFMINQFNYIKRKRSLSSWLKLYGEAHPDSPAIQAALQSTIESLPTPALRRYQHENTLKAAEKAEPLQSIYASKTDEQTHPSDSNTTEANNNINEDRETLSPPSRIVDKDIDTVEAPQISIPNFPTSPTPTSNPPPEIELNSDEYDIHRTHEFPLTTEATDMVKATTPT